MWRKAAQEHKQKQDVRSLGHTFRAGRDVVRVGMAME